MMKWFIIGVILICITLFLLKRTQVYIGYDSNINGIQWDTIKIQLWVFILIIILGLTPVINLLSFCIFFVYYLITIEYGDYRYCKLGLNFTDNKVIKYLKRILTIELF